MKLTDTSCLRAKKAVWTQPYNETDIHELITIHLAGVFFLVVSYVLIVYCGYCLCEWHTKFHPLLAFFKTISLKVYHHNFFAYLVLICIFPCRHFSYRPREHVSNEHVSNGAAWAQELTHSSWCFASFPRRLPIIKLLLTAQFEQLTWPLSLFSPFFLSPTWYCLLWRSLDTSCWRPRSASWTTRRPGASTPVARSSAFSTEQLKSASRAKPFAEGLALGAGSYTRRGCPHARTRHVDTAFAKLASDVLMCLF